MTDAARPNIVLVTVDSLRADHCGFMGYDRDTTPTLDKMAEAGLVFERAIAPGPSTPESMPAIFTGQWPVERETEAADASPLQRRRERIRTHMGARDTLPERLQRLGYTTGGFTPNPFTSRHFGFDQGFDHFEDFMDESTRGSLYDRVFQGFLEGSGVSSLARVGMNVWQREEVFKPWASYYDDVLAWTQQAEEPYFLWVFLMDAHNPYLPDETHRTQSRLAEFHANFEFWRQSHETPFSEPVHDRLITAYDDAVRYSDAFLARLRADLDSDESVIAVHGDHGEAFGEHGHYGHEPYLYEENVHVPLVVEGVGSGRVEQPFSLRGLSPLTGAFAGQTPPTIPNGPAVTYTEDGDAFGIYTADDSHIYVGTGTPSTRTDDPVAQLAELHVADQTERSTVSESVARLVAGRRL